MRVVVFAEHSKPHSSAQVRQELLRAWSTVSPFTCSSFHCSVSLFHWSSCLLSYRAKGLVDSRGIWIFVGGSSYGDGSYEFCHLLVVTDCVSLPECSEIPVALLHFTRSSRFLQELLRISFFQCLASSILIPHQLLIDFYTLPRIMWYPCKEGTYTLFWVPTFPWAIFSLLPIIGVAVGITSLNIHMLYMANFQHLSFFFI